MEKNLSTHSGSRNSPPAIFSLPSCFCGIDQDENENEESRLPSLLPTIAISPILLRRFAPITRYLRIDDPTLGLRFNQLAVDGAEKKVIGEKRSELARLDIVEETHITTDNDVLFPPIPKLQRRAVVSMRMEDFGLYQYGSLPEDEIRVIQLKDANSFAADIVLRLKVCKRMDIYKAVSYAWGPPAEPTDKVAIQETQRSAATLNVRTNLVTMLRHFRAKKIFDWLWIDAICINQASDQEKSTQVKRMADVYQNASQTLVWLGTVGIEDNRVFKQQFIGRRTPQLLSNLKQIWGNPMDRSIESELSLKAVRKHVEPLLTKRYFMRRWIIQELCFSKEIVLLDEHGELEFIVLDQASKFVLEKLHHLHYDSPEEHIEHTETEKNHDPIKEQCFSNALHLMHMVREWQTKKTHDLMRLLVSAHTSECHDGLDRLYSLAAFDKEQQSIKCKYENPKVEDLYKDFAKEECKRTLETLYCSGAFPSPSEQLPSWVPDWRSKRLWTPISLMHKQDVALTSFGSELREFGLFQESKNRPTVEGIILNVHGEIIGEVTDTHEISTIGGVLEFYSPHSRNLEATGKLLRTLTLDSIQDDRFAKSWFEKYEGSKVADCPLERHDSECDRSGSVTLQECNTLRRIEDVMFGRRPSVTEKGDWGVGPWGLRKGDSMVKLDGCRFPFVMRRQVC